MIKKYRILYGLEAADAGALKHLVYLVTRLDPILFDVTIIISACRSDRAYDAVREMEEAGATVVIIPMQRRISPWKDLKSLVKIMRHLKDNRYDAVHAHSSKAGILFRLAAWLKGVPCIAYTPHCFYFQGKTGVVRSLYAGIEKIMGLITDHIIVSNNERNSALKHRIVPAAKLKSINNAINFQEYEEYIELSALRHSLKIDDTCTIVGSVGRLTQQKDWETYIYAAAETVAHYPNIVFLIVGDGEQQEYLQQLVGMLGLSDKVLFTGYREDIQHIFSIIDIYVSTSLWEGLPYVLLEAMWFKKPVIATDLDYGDIIKDEENGYLVRCREYKRIAGKIEDLIRDSALSKKMGEQGHHRVKKYFRFAEFVRRHEELYLQ